MLINPYRFAGFTPADLFASGEAGDYYIFDADNTDASADGEVIGSATGLANGNDLTQTTAASKPLLKESGGLSWARFDGTDDLLQTAAFASPISQPTTMIVGVDYIDTGAGTRVVTGLTSGARQLLGGDGSNNIFAFAGTSLDSGLNNPQATAVWTVIFDGANGIIRKDGTQLATGDVGANAQDGLTVGAAFNATADTQVDVFSLIFVEGALTGDDLSDAEQWTADRCGVTL